MSCEQCKDLVDISDLSIPYVIRTCPKCSRKINLREPGENGHGIKLEKGDQFTLPAGFINISANPLKGTGTLSRHGLAWFAQLIFIEQLDKNPENLISQLKKNDEYCDTLLNSSKLILISANLQPV